MSVHQKRNRVLKTLRKLQIEQLEVRQTMNADLDDQISEAIPIQLQGSNAASRGGIINISTDVDMYRIQVAAGDIVDFDIDTTINGAGGLGSYLRLFNSRGDQLRWNDDAAAPGEERIGFDAYLRYQFESAGSFYVGVSNNINNAYSAVTGKGDRAGNANATGSYELRVQRLPVDIDDSIPEAENLGLILADREHTRDGIIDWDVDVDMYKFQVSAGQRVYFDVDTTWNGLGGLGGYMRLFNAQGTELAWNNDAAAPGELRIGFDPFLRYTFAAGGTYYVGISNWGNTNYSASTGRNDTPNWQHALGSYTLRMQAVPNDLDDTLQEAMNLGTISSTRAPFASGIEWDVDVDMFRFKVTRGQSVDFDIDTARNGPGQGNSLNSYLRLFNSSGDEIVWNDDGRAPDESTLGFDSFIRHRFATGGTYYVGVSNRGNRSYNAVTGGGDVESWEYAIGSYTLTVRTTPASRLMAAGQGAPDAFRLSNPLTDQIAVNSKSQQSNILLSAGSNSTNTMMAPVLKSNNFRSATESSDAWFSQLGRPQVSRTEDDSLSSNFNRIDFI